MPSTWRRLKANLKGFITELILPKILIKQETDRLLHSGEFELLITDIGTRAPYCLTEWNFRCESLWPPNKEHSFTLYFMEINII